MVSVESLLCEVTPLLEARLALKAAEKLFFGDRLLYEYCSNEAPIKSAPDSHDKKHKMKKENKKSKDDSTSAQKEVTESRVKSDGLREAIEGAKRTLKEALDDTNEIGPSVTVFELSKEVAALRNRSDEMKREIEKLRQDFQELIVYVQKPVSCRYALQRVGRRILILGDGNFSFTRAFAYLNPSTEIYTSVLENRFEYIAKYPSGEGNIANLQNDHPNVHILFSIDACSLPKEWIGYYDDIIWNFPHHCGKTNLRKSRQLMRDAFASIGRILSSGRFHVTLAKEQSGLDHTSVQSKRPFVFRRLPKHRSDSWQIIYIAAEEHLVLQEAFIFQSELFSTYVSSGYHGSERSFNNIDAETLTFQRTPTVTTIQELDNYENKILKIQGMVHEWRPFFQRDLSIIYLCSEKVSELEQILLSLIKELCGLLLVDFYELLRLRTVFSGQPNRIYRLVWQSWVIPLSRRFCNAIHERMKLNLGKRFIEKHLQMTGVNVPLVSKKQPPLEQHHEVVEDEDFDLFASSDDEESAEKERIRNERLKEYAEKKAKKPETIAKSSVILDIKPWDDTTNMQEMEELVRAIKKDGLVWGSAKLIPLAYGIRVLQIICVVEDEKVSVDDLIEQITEQISDHVQSVDIVAFNKI